MRASPPTATPGIRFFGRRYSPWRPYREKCGLDGGIDRRQENRGEVLIFDAGERERAVGVDRAVLRGLRGIANQLVFLHVVADGGDWLAGIGDVHIAETGAPGDLMRNARAVTLDFVGYCTR